MLKLNVGKGRQVIKLPQSVAILGLIPRPREQAMAYAILRYSGYRVRGVCALQSSSYMYLMTGNFLVRNQYNIKPGVYRAAEGSERTYNLHSANIDDEIY